MIKKYFISALFILAFLFCCYRDLSLAQVKSIKPTSWQLSHPTWDIEIKNESEKYLQFLEKASDVEKFCPGYLQGDKAFRIGFWAELGEQISYFESGWDPAQVTFENELSKDSVGLFQFSVEDDMTWCNHSSLNDLQDPINSIQCYLPMAAKLINGDKIIAFGSTLRPGPNQAKGLGRYFSTMWPYATSYKHQGHVEEIMAATKEWCK